MSFNVDKLLKMMITHLFPGTWSITQYVPEDPKYWRESTLQLIPIIDTWDIQFIAAYTYLSYII
jgi:hypothetical protein